MFVMPDLIRHPGTIEKTGFGLSPGMTFLLKNVVYGQTLIKTKNPN